MKKLLTFLVVLFGIGGMLTMTAYATDTTEPPTEETPTEEVVDDGVVEDVTLQLETIKNVIVSAVVAFLSSATFIVMARYAINGVVKTIKDKVKEGELQNKISTENALIVNQRVDELKAYIEDNVLAEFAKFVEQFKTVDTDMKTLIDQFKTRDAQLGELLEQGLVGDDDVEE